MKAGSSHLRQNDVRWPSGRMEAVANVVANQIITIAERKGIVARQPFSR